jgi:hypothetical protein
MKKPAVLLAAVLLIAGTLILGCTSKAPGPAPTSEPPTVVQGTLEDVDTSKNTVTVDTPRGPSSVYPIGTSTSITIDGKACSLDDLLALEASGEGYNCTVVIDSEGNTVAVNVAKLPEPASVAGTISDVNLEKSTITIKTPEGEKIYEVDPATGIIIGGVSCDLALIQSLIEGGFPSLSCSLIYSLDAKGKAVYVDVVKPPSLVSVEGTVKDVDLVGSTITVKTAQGDKVYDIDATTGLAIGGQVCDLALLNALLAAGEQPSCTIISSKDQQGNALYVDVAYPEGLTSVGGTIKDVDAAKSTITVKTAQGDKVYDVDPNTGIVIGGTVCDLSFVDQVTSLGEPLSCTIVSSKDQQGNAIFVDVSFPKGLTAVEGTIKDVDVAKSTITVKTAQGDKVYQVDSKTGIVIGGVVCDLAFIDQVASVGGDPAACTIITTTDKLGNALYIDVSNPPDLSSVEGTITKVDVAKSTVTIMTDKGERTFEVDPQTGLILSGRVCSLADIQALDAQLPGEDLGCTIIYYLDDQGQAVYLEVTRPAP